MINLCCRAARFSFFRLRLFGRICAPAGWLGLLLAFTFFSGSALATTRTELELASSANPSRAGQEISLTATVTPRAATGSVVFMDGNITIGRVELSGGTATLTRSFGIGTHRLRAFYTGVLPERGGHFDDANADRSDRDAKNVYTPAPSGVLVQVVIAKDASTTTLRSDPNPSYVGRSALLTATVTGANPTGIVTFRDGETVMGTATLGAGSATLASSFATPGPHTLTAVYTGDVTHEGSTSVPVVHTVNTLPAASISLSSSPNPAAFGDRIEVRAVVTGQSPTGTVEFKSGSAALGSSVLANGAASLEVSTLPVGSHSLAAVYSGDGSNGAATSVTLVQVVNKAATTTTLSSSSNPVAFGQPVTFRASVAGVNPTGGVTFYDGSSSIGYAQLANGIATLSVTSLDVGSRNLKAVYEGDANNAGAVSPVLVQTVAQAPPGTLTLTATPNPSAYGQSVQFNVTLTAVRPTGTIDLLDGTRKLATIDIWSSSNSVSKSFAVGDLPIGTRQITAVYSGDSNNPGLTSAVLSQNVTKVKVSMGLIGPEWVDYGQSATWTARVTGIEPTGTVTFKIGTNVLAAVPLSGTGNVRTAAYTGAMSTVGWNRLTAEYSGDDVHGAASRWLDVLVRSLKSTTSITASINPSAQGQTVTWTATVTGSNSAAGVNPTGSVIFRDNMTTLATVPLGNGAASYTSSSLAVGYHRMIAVFTGDAAYEASSASLDQFVQLPTSTTLVSSANPSVAGTPLTLTAAVAGGSNPSGMVRFRSGSNVIGSSALNGRVATLVIGTLTAGTHAITAVYEGDSSNGASTSTPLAQIVQKASPAASLSANPAMPAIGENITLQARVEGFSPAGNVTFLDGSTSLGVAPLRAGVATIALNSLAQGSRSLVAQYEGDANNMPVVSAPVAVVVAARADLTTQFGYDASGRPNTIVDGNGIPTYLYHDSLGRLVQRQQPPNPGSATPTAVDIRYDGQDKVTSIIDPRSVTTSYANDGLGGVTNQNNPDAGATQYTYDAKGNMLTSTDARGKLTQYTLDALDRVTRIAYPTGTPTAYEYDGGTNPNPAQTGLLTGISDESGTTRYSHDALGRLTAKAATIAGKTFTNTYGWGDSGSELDKPTSISYPSGNRVNYVYDAKGDVTAITVTTVGANGAAAGGSTVSLLSGITYTHQGKLAGWLWADGKPRVITHDGAGQVAGYSLGDPQGSGSAAGTMRVIERDKGGRITGYRHTNAGTAAADLDQTFGYDALNRLSTATIGSVTIVYTYDANGNRTAKTIAATTYANTVSATSNRLTQTQDATGTANIQYDAAGHIISDATNTYSYNDRGRMISATTPSGNVSFLYNGLEQRAYKTSSLGISYYVYDEAGQLLGEYDTSGKPVYETIYLQNMPVGVMKQTGSAASADIAVSLYNVYADHIDTPRLITRQDHITVWRWDTAEAFGATAPAQNPTGQGTFVFNQRFPGQVFDAETGLNQNVHREYDPRTGRYIQFDPIGLRGGLNGYAYVDNSPLMYSDPKGLVKWKGEMYGVTAINLGGGGQFWFDLKSECVNGKYAYIRVYASALGVGLGIKYTATASSISFDDHLSEIYPEGFAGTFKMASAGFGAGLVGGYSAVRLGNNTADFSAAPSPGIGVDASISGLIGRSTLVSKEIKDCECRR